MPLTLWRLMIPGHTVVAGISWKLMGKQDSTGRKRDKGQMKTVATQVAAIVSAGIGETFDLVVGIPWQWNREKENDSPSH